MTSCPLSRARLVRRGAVAVGLVGALGGSLGSATANAVPVSTTLTYTCNFPLLPPEPLTLKISSDIPATIPLNTATGAFKIAAEAQVSEGAAFGLRAVEAATIEGSAIAAASLDVPGQTEPLPLDVETIVEKTTLPATGGFTTKATGSTPASLNFKKAGTVTINVGDVVLTLTPRLADGTKTGLDEFETECIQKPGQNPTLAKIVVGDGGGGADTVAPTKPGPPAAIANPTGAALSWAPSTDAVGVTGYDVYQDGVKVQTVTGASATLTGLSSAKTYRVKVQAKDAAGNLSAFSDEIDVKPTSPVGVGYDLAGSARIKTLTTGTVPIRGAFNAPVKEGAFSGDLVLNPVKARLTALGFIPVTAQLQFAMNGQTTGTLTGTVLTSSSKVRIKIPQVSLFGTIPLAGGTTCQTRSISTVNLKSTDAFDPATGGTIGGTFAISDLSGCGALNGLVSPLTAGSGSTLSLKLTPKSIS